MPVQNFTDRGVRALPIPTSGQVDYFDAGRKPAGFGVRISYKGTRAWIFIYRYNGVKRRMKLALVDEIGLKGARDLAWDAHAKARKGLDPASERKKLTERAETVAELARSYIEEYAKPKKRSWKKDLENLDRDVIPQIGRKRLVDVTRQDIRDLLKPILDRGAPVQAKPHARGRAQDAQLGNPGEGPLSRKSGGSGNEADRERGAEPVPARSRVQALLGCTGP